MVAENKLGKEELTTSIEVQQAADLRSVLRKSDEKDKADMDPNTLRQYRVGRNIEEKIRGRFSCGLV